MKLKPEIIEYFKKSYSDNIKINDFEEKNLTFDLFLSDRNINISVEYKERFFNKSQKYFLDKNDILIELVQSFPYINELPKINNSNINDEISIQKLNTAIGWFYKCNSDRLIYFRNFENKIYDVIDLDFRYFKLWFLNNIENLKLQYAPGTTGTINAIVEISQIPSICLKYGKF